MLKNTIYIPSKTVACAGAKIAIASVFGYSLFVMLYAITRSSLIINNIMPSGERNNILLSNGFSIAYSVAIFSLIMALLSSVVGALASVILKKLLVYFNPQFNFIKYAIISATMALTILVIIYALLYTLLKDWMTYNYIETFSFWFLFPAVIFLSACIIGGMQLNKILLTNIKS